MKIEGNEIEIKEYEARIKEREEERRAKSKIEPFVRLERHLKEMKVENKNR